jgi:hypothetical protein
MKKPLVTALLLTVVLYPHAARAGGTLPMVNNSHQIQAILNSISADSVRAYLDTIVGFFSRNTIDDTVSQTRGIGAARRWVFRKFQQFNIQSGGRLQPQYFDFTGTICGITQLYRNVNAVLPGTVTPNRYFVVSGHLDTRGDPNVACAAGIFSPGANDDASGTAASIELARVMSQYQFDASIIFMAVVGEDQGLFGSEAYAAFAQTNNIRIDGMITNDVIGNIVGSNNIVDSLSVRHFSSDADATPHRQMARYMKRQADTYYPLMTVNIIPARDRPNRGGDHFSFQNHGYTAVRFTEPNENLNNQHTPTDIVANMSPAYTARVARVNACGLASLAWAPEQPAQPTVVDAGTGTSLRVQWSSVPPVADLAGYRVAVRDSAGLFWTSVYTAGNVNQFTVTGLTPNVQLYVSVAAYDTAGNESLYSPEVLAMPTSIPSTPANFSSTSFSSNIRLNWSSSPQLDINRYRIYRSTRRTSGFARYDSVGSAVVQYTDANVAPHTIYFYQVRAVDTDGNESAPTITAAGQRVAHDAGILLVDATRDSTGGVLTPTDSTVDAFYQSLLIGFNVTREWDVVDSAVSSIRISDGEMGAYSTVIWYSDVRGSQGIYQDTAAIRKYLQQGGRMFIGGWQLSASLKAGAPVGVNSYPTGSFVPAMLKIDSTSTNGPLSRDFVTAVATSAGYANVSVDSARIPNYGGTLVFTDVVLPPFSSGPAQMIYSHHGILVGSTFEGKPVGWRYLGNDFKIVVFDFPLYYMVQAQARAALRQALIELGEVVSVEDNSKTIPGEFALHQNFPNPFNPATRLSFDVPVKSTISLVIYNLLGEEVRTLMREERTPGSYTLQWDGRDGRGRNVSTGVYFCAFTGSATDGSRSTYSAVRKMLLVK